VRAILEFLGGKHVFLDKIVLNLNVAAAIDSLSTIEPCRSDFSYVGWSWDREWLENVGIGGNVLMGLMIYLECFYLHCVPYS
jgi:hypothetical protein